MFVVVVFQSVTLILGPIYETRDLVYLISGYCKYVVENAKSLSIIDMTGTETLEGSADEGKRELVKTEKLHYVRVIEPTEVN